MPTQLKQYVVDAFTDRVLGGNPAAVCILKEWLPVETMMGITIENNLSETAFAVKEGDVYALRWFTPGGEIDLCGHATLATASVILRDYEPEAEEVVFTTMSGELRVKKAGDRYELVFPAYQLKEVPVTDVAAAIGVRPQAAYLGRDLLCVLENAEAVKTYKPDFDKLTTLDGLLLHVTAKGDDGEFDCVSRSFASKLKVPEDPVCGSGHCHIVPYWAGVLGRPNVNAYLASARGGKLYCRLEGDRVILGGQSVFFSEATIYLPE